MLTVDVEWAYMPALLRPEAPMNDGDNYNRPKVAKFLVW